MIVFSKKNLLIKLNHLLISSAAIPHHKNGGKKKKKKKDNTSRHLSILNYPIYISCHLSIRKDLYLGCQIHVSCHLSIPKEWANFSYCIFWTLPSPTFSLYIPKFWNVQNSLSTGHSGTCGRYSSDFFFLHIFFSFLLPFISTTQRKQEKSIPFLVQRASDYNTCSNSCRSTLNIRHDPTQSER